jgi:molybdopterin-containing oxidoreductase family iron-sulfur binding subunit
MYDSIPYDGILNANETTFGLRALPSYHFDKANTIVSFGADFIGNWLNNDYSTDYVAGRNPKNGKMSKHYQIESNLSLTGSNADKRIAIKPSEQKALISELYNSLVNDTSSKDKRLHEMVEKLKKQ